MYSVIPLTLDNVDSIKPWAEEFMHTLEEPCDPEYYVSRWRAFLTSGIGVGWWLVIDGVIVGGIGGIVAPDILSGKDTLIELYWYITPPHRRHGVMVYRAMERYVNEHGIRWAMIHMEKSMPESLKKFYASQGFRLIETQWVRDPIRSKSCQ